MTKTALSNEVDASRAFSRHYDDLPLRRILRSGRQVRAKVQRSRQTERRSVSRREIPPMTFIRARKGTRLNEARCFRPPLLPHTRKRMTAIRVMARIAGTTVVHDDDDTSNPGFGATRQNPHRRGKTVESKRSSVEVASVERDSLEFESKKQPV